MGDLSVGEDTLYDLISMRVFEKNRKTATKCEGGELHRRCHTMPRVGCVLCIKHNVTVQYDCVNVNLE